MDADGHNFAGMDGLERSTSGGFTYDDQAASFEEDRIENLNEQADAMNEADRLQVSFAKLWDNYPGHDQHPTDPAAKDSIWSMIGGYVEKNEWELDKKGNFVRDQNGNKVPNNTCAVRLSYALNHSGVTIPRGSGTVSGADGKQYFLRVAEVN